ncbi:MAG: hypothetical protein AB8U69_04175 [Anaplasma ovis]
MASERTFSVFGIDSRPARSSVGSYDIGETRGGAECCVLLVSSIILFLLVYGLVAARVGSSGKLAVGIMGCALVAFLAAALILLPIMALRDLGRGSDNRSYDYLALCYEADDQYGARSNGNTDLCGKRVTYRVVVLCALVAALIIGAILYALSNATAAHFAVVVMIFIMASLPAVTMLMCDDVVEHEGGRLHAICTLVEGVPPDMSAFFSHDCDPVPTTLASESEVAVKGVVASKSAESQSKSIR